jgi:hypothetical protein
MIASVYQKDEFDKETVEQVLHRVFQYPAFWLMMCGKMNLLMVGQFIAFIPAYLTTSPSLKMSAEAAARASAAFAVSVFTI